jgi:hypothetical protein
MSSQSIQLDPLPSSTTVDRGTKTSLVPVRRPSEENISTPLPATSTASNIEEVQLPQWVEEPSHDGSVGQEDDKEDESTLLRLPSPPLQDRPPAFKLRLWGTDVLVLNGPPPKALIFRTIKSMVLVAKVSLFSPFHRHECD